MVKEKNKLNPSYQYMKIVTLYFYWRILTLFFSLVKMQIKTLYLVLHLHLIQV